MSSWEDNPGHAGLTLTQLAWDPLGASVKELEEVSREREVWVVLLRLLLLPPRTK